MKDCNSCGKCCIKYSNGGLSAAKHEINEWEENSPEIYKYVKDGLIWADPKTGEQITLCPFLSKQENSKVYTCDIYFDRPDDCRYYPSTVDEMIADDCEMIEKKDLLDRKKARATLDLIMSDSRG